MKMNIAFLCLICKQKMTMFKEFNNHSKKPAWNTEKHENNVMNLVLSGNILKYGTSVKCNYILTERVFSYIYFDPVGMLVPPPPFRNTSRHRHSRHDHPCPSSRLWGSKLQRLSSPADSLPPPSSSCPAQYSAKIREAGSCKNFY